MFMMFNFFDNDSKNDKKEEQEKATPKEQEIIEDIKNLKKMREKGT